VEASGQPPVRRLRAGAVLNAGGQAVAAVAGALTTVVVARMLGPDGAGAFAIALTLLALLTTVGAAGLDAGITYLVGSGAWSPWRAFLRAQAAAAVLGLIAAALGVLARLLVPEAFEGLDSDVVLIAVAGVPFALSWLYASSVAVAMSRYEAYVALPVVQSAAMLAGVALLCALDDLRGAVIGLAISQALAAAAGIAWGSGRVRRAGGDGGDGGGLRPAFRFGVRTYPANVLQFLNFRLDLFLLNALATTADVGRYSVAVSVTSVMWLLPRALSAVVFPRVAHLSSEAAADSEHRDMVEEKSVRHVVAITVVVALALALALVGLVELVYGSDFEEAIVLGLILLPGVSLLGIGNVLFATILGRGHSKYSLYSSLIATPVTMVLYVALIPSLDAAGAALASTLSYALSFALAVVYYRRVTGRAVLPLLVPGRDELRDYARALADVRTRLG
jgi:O-antigen/teichoic acid export membrane protein